MNYKIMRNKKIYIENLKTIFENNIDLDDVAVLIGEAIYENVSNDIPANLEEEILSEQIYNIKQLIHSLNLQIKMIESHIRNL